MKKFLLAALSVMTIFALVGCGDNGGGSTDDPITPPTTQSFKITFDTNVPEDATKVKDANPAEVTVTRPATMVTEANMPEWPEVEDYAFTGWGTKADSTEAGYAAFTGTTTVNASITVYAQWAPGFTVTFDKNHNDAAGFTEANPKQKTVISPATTIDHLPTNPTRGDDWEFDGWYLESGTTQTTPWLASTEVTESITVYAKWAKGHVVSFFKNDGTDDVHERVIVPLGESFDPDDIPAAPIRDAYSFAFWSYANDVKYDAIGNAKQEFDPDAELTGPESVYAIWEFVGGKPTFNADKSVMTINRPFFEVSGTAEADENTLIFTTAGGNASFTFPEFEADGSTAIDISEYDFFTIDRVSSGNGEGARINELGGSGFYATIPLGIQQNTNPWLNNNDWQILSVSGPSGANAGFTIVGGGAAAGNACTMIVNSIRFYKAPKYDVTFDWDLAGYNDPVPSGLTDVIGQTTITAVTGRPATSVPGPGVGAANWPAIEPGDEVTTDDGEKYFLSWNDGETQYTATTPLTKNVTLKAVWDDDPPPMDRFVTVVHNHQPVFYFPVQASGKTYGDIKKYKMTIMVTAQAVNGDGCRVHLVYAGQGTTGDVDSYSAPTHAIDQTTTGDPKVNYGSTAWGGNRFSNNNGGATVAAIMGADYLNKWVTLEYDVLTNGDYGATWTSKAAETANLALGVGLASNNAGAISYFIKDVTLICEDNTEIEADVTKANVGHFWANVPSSHPNVITSFQPSPKDE